MFSFITTKSRELIRKSAIKTQNTETEPYYKIINMQRGESERWMQRFIDRFLFCEIITQTNSGTDR
jgi:hypothetical protein